MLHKNKKSIIALLLTVIFTFTFCFSNISFASALNDGYGNVEERAYYLENCYEGLYLNVDPYLPSPIINENYGFENERWEMVYVSNGYYHIINVSTGKYLTAPDNNYSYSLIELSDFSTAKTNRQLWKFIPVDDFPMTYWMQAKSQESYGLCAASDLYEGTGGYDLVQLSMDEYSGYDKWYFVDFERITLIGITGFTNNHNHTTPLLFAEGNFQSAGKYPAKITPTSIATASVLNYLENSEFFLIYSDGDTGPSGSFIYLNGTKTLLLNTSDIYNYSTGSHIDMSSCEVAVFAGCDTAYNTTYNLPLAAVHAGSDCAIGLANDPGCENIGDWINEFSYFYSYDYGAVPSTEIAVERLDGAIDFSDFAIYTQTSTQGG